MVFWYLWSSHHLSASEYLTTWPCQESNQVPMVSRFSLPPLTRVHVAGSWAAPVHDHGLGDQRAENQTRHRHLSGDKGQSWSPVTYLHAYYCIVCYLHPYCLLSRYYPLLPITCHIIYWVLLEHAHANQLDDPSKGKPVMLCWICRYLRLSPLIISILQLDQTNLENKLRHQVLN